MPALSRAVRRAAAPVVSCGAECATTSRRFNARTGAATISSPSRARSQSTYPTARLPASRLDEDDSCRCVPPVRPRSPRMSRTDPPVPPGGWSTGPRPAPAEIDVFGLTDSGRVRRENQDHFLIASLHKLLRVHQSSIPPDDLTPLVTESRGFVFLVADGVGGRPDGAQASGTVIRAIAHYVTHLTDL